MREAGGIVSPIATACSGDAVYDLHDLCRHLQPDGTRTDRCVQVGRRCARDLAAAILVFEGGQEPV